MCVSVACTCALFSLPWWPHQDTCDEVRDGFMHKLHKGLGSLKLPLPYLSILALSGVEPRRETRTRLHLTLVHNVERRRECIKQHSKAKRRERQCVLYRLICIVQ